MYSNLRYFPKEEYREWADDMSPLLVFLVDRFREEWGDIVEVSPHPDALGRNLTLDNLSQHNFRLYGVVNAGDYFPKGMNTPEDRARAFKIAKKLGFTGIGIYADTTPSNMIHLDVRNTRIVGNPATWSRIDGEYKPIEDVL